MLIATLPFAYQEDLIEEIISCPFIDGARYNTGYSSPYSPKETLERIHELVSRSGKKLWIDLEGRQLRVANWSYPKSGGRIILNRAVEVDCPAKIHFRGDGWYDLKIARENVVYVEPQPRRAIGESQTANIQGNFKISGYLTDMDKQYIQAAVALGINNFMLSFVEETGDITEVEKAVKEKKQNNNNAPELVLKIESLKGLRLLDNISGENLKDCNLMAARDDLMINIGDNKAEILPALENIISADPRAILASRIFSGLEHSKEVSMGDLSDLRLAQLMGYKNFMLSDGICQYHFGMAIKAWKDFLELYPMGGD